MKRSLVKETFLSSRTALLDSVKISGKKRRGENLVSFHSTYAFLRRYNSTQRSHYPKTQQLPRGKKEPDALVGDVVL